MFSKNKWVMIEVLLVIWYYYQIVWYQAFHSEKKAVFLWVIVIKFHWQCIYFCLILHENQLLSLFCSWKVIQWAMLYIVPWTYNVIGKRNVIFFCFYSYMLIPIMYMLARNMHGNFMWIVTSQGCTEEEKNFGKFIFLERISTICLWLNDDRKEYIWSM